MSRSADWPIAPAAREILAALEEAGWRLNVFHLPESLRGGFGKTTEMRAVKGEEQQVHHVSGWSMASDTKCATKLAEACGLSLV